jgi:hypothetical protein
MRQGKAPLCDGHYREMSPHPSTLFREDVFKCASTNCGRYYACRYGYFNMIAGESPASEKIDPARRRMKVCSTKQHAHSYMAITRPKNSGPGTKALWCWHCYACSKIR